MSDHDNYHILRLSPTRRSFFCPLTRLHLVAPFRPEGRLPVEANLLYVRRAIASGGLLDISGTIVGPNAGLVRQKVTPVNAGTAVARVIPPEADVSGPGTTEETAPQETAQDGDAKKRGNKKNK